MRLALCELEALGWGSLGFRIVPWYRNDTYTRTGKCRRRTYHSSLLAEFLRGFSLRTLIFLLDMVLPQLDAYHSGRQLQHLQPRVSVELAQQQSRRYQYEAYAGFHVIQLLTDGAPILLFRMESNVMAGRALFGCNCQMVSDDAPYS